MPFKIALLCGIRIEEQSILFKRRKYERPRIFRSMALQRTIHAGQIAEVRACYHGVERRRTTRRALVAQSNEKYDAFPKQRATQAQRFPRKRNGQANTRRMEQTRAGVSGQTCSNVGRYSRRFPVVRKGYAIRSHCRSRFHRGIKF